ncbi:helix-turn-helix domain-containing protein [Sphaerobacter thermophilus]|uniref:Phage transcriptional regulator, AlpA n=1 Tax=Sphaerobacter thermophilus (strain ATCC 49802 / DSM 20745 / KCCM 41009 / NCIMB 13125 / S 6022) TaxID=479434 RepID=D1C8V3_SPHTD|nr:helix-turn-helix domain-containing protein [Sphaerobacter thermophilus]ACZ40246.1 phage transcriptional regulator, AlpA [Sphaerobacter thermophilus DSM 20745]
MTAAQVPSSGQLLYTINDVTALTRISRSTIYEHIAAGRLKVVRIGRAVRITRGELERWISDLEERGGDDIA